MNGVQLFRMRRPKIPKEFSNAEAGDNKYCGSVLERHQQRIRLCRLYIALIRSKIGLNEGVAPTNLFSSGEEYADYPLFWSPEHLRVGEKTRVGVV